MWVIREGKETQEVAKEDSFTDMRLSPDGRRALVGRAESDASKIDLCLLNLDRSTTTKLTFDGRATATERSFPSWSPDGQWIAHSSRRSGRYKVYRLNVATGQEEQLTDGADPTFVTDWSRDGRHLVIVSGAEISERSAWALALNEGDGGRKLIPIARARTGYASSPALSPDGKWVAYDSNESGQIEVYVQPFPPNAPGKSGRWQVSNWGWQPKWRGDGKELYFTTGQGIVMSAAVRTAGGMFESDVPRELFRLPITGRFDVSADPQRFLCSRRPPMRARGLRRSMWC